MKKVFAPLIRKFIKNKKIINQGELLNYMRSIGYKNPIDGFNNLNYRKVFVNKKIIRTLVGNKKYFTKEEKKLAHKKAYKKYLSSEKGLAYKKYLSSEEGKAAKRKVRKKYYKSEHGQSKYRKYYDENRLDIIKKKTLYNKSEKGKETIKKFWLSPKGPAARKRYNQSEQGRKKNLKYARDRYNNDPSFRIRNNLSSRLGTWLKSLDVKKKAKTMELVGCSKGFCKRQLEKQFYPHPITGEKMTWNNHSNKGWHIDHIIPFESFKKEDLNDIEIQKKIMHYTNLQPLWAEENLKKGGKVN